MQKQSYSAGAPLPGGFGPNAGGGNNAKKGDPNKPSSGKKTLTLDVEPIQRSKSTPAPSERNHAFADVTPRSLLLLKKRSARKLQSAFRRRNWMRLLQTIGKGAGGCFCANAQYRPLVARDGEIRGVRGPSGRWYVDRAFGCLSPHNPIRQFFILLIEQSWFDHLILVAIVINCCVLAVTGRPEDDWLYFDPARVHELELVFVWIFTGELACKSIAMGIFTDPYHALLSDPWNRIDLVVVATAWAPLLFPQLENYSSLRALRAFRPLRAAHMLPGVRKQIDTIAKAMPALADVMKLVGLVMIAFGLLGMQLFKGSLRLRCYDRAGLGRLDGVDVDALVPGDLAPPGAVPIDPEEGVCNPTAKEWQGRGQWALARCSAAEICLNYDRNPGRGTISFDNIFNALMTVFMCVNGEGWSGVMYATQRAIGGPGPPTYFVILTLFGTFYIVNLFLAVLWETYSSLPVELTPEQQIERRMQQAIRENDPDSAEAEQPLILSMASGGGGERAGGGALGGKARIQRMLMSQRGKKSHVSVTSDSFVALSCTERLARLLQSRVFRITIMVLILANTTMMMIERHPMPRYQKELIEYGNLAFFAVYFVEMILKLVALGVAEYWADPFNVFDGAVVLLSAVEICADYLHMPLPLNIQILRALRLLRIFKLARSWSSLYVVIRSLVETLLSLRDLLIVLVLILFVFALLGMQLFGNKVDGLERKMFDRIEHAMVTVFVTVTGESWPEMWKIFAPALGMWTGLFFVVVVAIGDYIILNLVIAIVIGEVVQADAYVREANAKQQKLKGVARVRNRKMRVHGGYELKPDVREEGLELNDILADDDGPGACDECARPLRECLDARSEYSLFLFRPEHPVRRLANWILRARLPGTPITLEGVVILTILFSSMAVAFDSGCHRAGGGTSGLFDDAHEQTAHWLIAYLSFASLVSLVEIAVKVIAYGFFDYLRQPWHQLDALIAFICVAEFVETGLPTGLVLRSVHVLRPLRLVARLAGLQKVVLLFYEILPRVVNILLVYGLFMSIFAVLGIQFFAGKFGRCATDESLTTKAACEAAPHGLWQSQPHMGSFDNIFSASLLLFEISSLEGWPRVMYMGIDAVGVDVAGEVDANPIMSIYFILWVFLGGFVVLNVFVGVLIDTFAVMEMRDTFGGIFTSHRQQHWVETLQASTIVKPVRRHREPDGSACRKAIYRLVTAHSFEVLILCFIFLNTCLMMFDSYGISETAATFLAAANDVCTTIFVLEALFKIVGLGLSNYLNDGWNVFDLFVVAIAVCEKALDIFSSNSVKGSLLRVARLARAMRVLRTLRLAHQFKQIQSLLMTLLYSVPALVNILSIFTIIMFVYAVLGMELFGRVMHGEFLNEEANFCVFSRAMLTMFRCATGEDWNGIMHDALVGPEDGCDPEAGNCGTWVAIPFFVSYIILTTFVVLKILIALIIENFKLSMREDARLVRTAHRDAFVEAWAEFDPDATGKLGVGHLPALMRKLVPPLGPDPREFHTVGAIKERDISRFIISLDIPAYDVANTATGGTDRVVLFHELLLCLTTRALDEQRKAEARHANAEAAWGRAGGATIAAGRVSHAPAPSAASKAGNGGAADASLRHTWAPGTKASQAGLLEQTAAAFRKREGGGGGGGAPGDAPAAAPAVAPEESVLTITADDSLPPNLARRKSVTDESDLTALRQLFRERILENEQDGDEDIAKMLRSSMLAGPKLQRGRSKSVKYRRSPMAGRNAFGDGKDEDEQAPAETVQLTSLSDEYAVILIQRRWRERKSRFLQSAVKTELKKHRSSTTLAAAPQ